MLRKRIHYLLVVLDVLLFAWVLMIFHNGWTSDPLNLIVLLSWITVFIATILSFTVDMYQSGDEWYQYGITITSGILIALIFGMLIGYDIYGTTMLMPFAVIGVFIINWMFTDRSEDAMDEDLERLRNEIE